MIGELAILNVAAGDTKLSFDPANKAEVQRASAIVEDMLKRGFALLIQIGEDEEGQFILVISVASFEGRHLGSLSPMTPNEARNFAASIIHAANLIDGGANG